MSEVKSIAVIGAGTMGSGITMTAAISGLEAWQIDVSQDQLDRARGYHQKNLARNVAKERMTQDEADQAASRIQYVTSMEAASAADWAVEAATENVELKKTLFAEMVKTFGSDVVLASSLNIS